MSDDDAKWQAAFARLTPAEQARANDDMLQYGRAVIATSHDGQTRLLPPHAIVLASEMSWNQ